MTDTTRDRRSIYAPHNVTIVNSWLDDRRTLDAMLVADPCIVLGCRHEYGHDGAHAFDTAPIFKG